MLNMFSFPFQWDQKNQGSEKVQHIVTRCKMQTGTMYTEHHNQIGDVVYSSTDGCSKSKSSGGRSTEGWDSWTEAPTDVQKSVVLGAEPWTGVREPLQSNADVNFSCVAADVTKVLRWSKKNNLSIIFACEQ